MDVERSSGPGGPDLETFQHSAHDPTATDAFG
jgi:hypothetical protein